MLANLRRAIFDGRFRPGDRLIERELCTLAGVGRSSIREALRQLEAEGLIVTVPNRGPVVRRFSAAEVDDLYQVRGVLEGLAGKLFALRADDEAIAALRGAVDALVDAAEAGDTGQTLGREDQFYDVLLRGCGSQAIRSTLESILNRVTVLRATALSQPGRPAELLGELRAILAAVEQRDLEAASRACVEHVERAAAAALRAARETEAGATRGGARVPTGDRAGLRAVGDGGDRPEGTA